jgi:hypothetical protein
MKHDQNEKDPLARWADQALRQMPIRRAPAGFRAGVLAEIRRQAALPWYRRPWMQWSRQQRWLSAMAFVALAFVVLGIVVPSLTDAASRSGAGEFAAELTRSFTLFITGIQSLVEALRLALTRIPSPYLAAGLAALATIWVSTIGLGAACWRVATHSR